MSSLKTKLTFMSSLKTKLTFMSSVKTKLTFMSSLKIKLTFMSSLKTKLAFRSSVIVKTHCYIPQNIRKLGDTLQCSMKINIKSPPSCRPLSKNCSLISNLKFLSWTNIGICCIMLFFRHILHFLIIILQNSKDEVFTSAPPSPPFVRLG